jgi:hypothetical protein
VCPKAEIAWDGQLEWVHTIRNSRTLTIYAWQQGPANRGWRRSLKSLFAADVPRCKRSWIGMWDGELLD